MALPYRCKRGATLVLPLEVPGAQDADLAGIAIDAGLKAAVNGSYVPDDAVPRVATFAVAPRAAAPGIGPGWNLTLTASQTLALEPGSYVTDAAYTLADGQTVGLTEVLVLSLAQAVSL